MPERMRDGRLMIVKCNACGQKNSVKVERANPRCGKCGLPLRECDVNAAKSHAATDDLFESLFGGFKKRPY